MSSTDERLAILMYPQTTQQLMKGEEPNEEPEMVQVPASPKRSGDQQVELPDTSRAVEVRCSRGPGLLIVGLRLHHYTMGTGDPLVYKTGPWKPQNEGIAEVVAPSASWSSPHRIRFKCFCPEGGLGFSSPTVLKMDTSWCVEMGYQYPF